MTIIEFLDARLKEDLVGAAITPPHPAWHDRMNHGEHLVRLIAIQRAIVALHKPFSLNSDRITGCDVCSYRNDEEELQVSWPCPTVRLIASAYSEHPDYNPKWKP